MNPDQTEELITNCNGSHRTYLGSKTSILGVEEKIALHDDHRVKHTLTTGATGAGKSQELAHVALQDVYKGRGLAIINSKGKLLDEFLAKLPESRYEDLIYVNPATDPITGINVLEPAVPRTAATAVKTNQIEIIVSNLIQLFKRRSDNWGDRMGRVLASLLRAGIEANIEHQASYTLLDIKHCVTDTTELLDLIDETGDPELRSQLVTIKDRLSDRELEPVVRRLNDFTENKTVRHVIAADTSAIDFQDVLHQQKLLVVDVREGVIGTTVAELLTSIIITKIWAAAQTRYNQHNGDHAPFYLFVDELQTFPSEGTHFAEILSKAREYHLGCWLATQYLSQLPRPMRNAVMNNCRTKLVFDPSGSEDLSKLTRMLHGIDQDRVTTLGDYRAVVQKPGTHQRNHAQVIETFPPWAPDDTDLDQLKARGTVATERDSAPRTPPLGKGANAGGQHHAELLSRAKQALEQRGLEVKELYQEAGSDRPDGQVQLPDGRIAHLEAEHATLSKPAKTLQNLQRAHQQDRDCIFVVQDGNAEKLHNILSDPVNRDGNQHTDEHGSFNYYTDSHGNPFTEIEQFDDARYKILEVTENGLRQYNRHQQLDNRQSEDREQKPVEALRGIDRTVLRCIRDGRDDIQKITSATGFPNHKVNYSFEKLEDLGFITVSKPDGTTERTIDGQKRVFQHPKQAELTNKAGGYIEGTKREDRSR